MKSNAQRDGRSRYGRGGEMGVNYEVRTKAWSCTCPAFAFAAFSNVGSPPVYENVGGREGNDTLEDMVMRGAREHEAGDDINGRWQWGGVMQVEDEVPLCKHLLACVLAERWVGAADLIEEREIGREEMAGWAAGCGD